MKIEWDDLNALDWMSNGKQQKFCIIKNVSHYLIIMIMTRAVFFTLDVFHFFVWIIMVLQNVQPAIITTKCKNITSCGVVYLMMMNIVITLAHTQQQVSNAFMTSVIYWYYLFRKWVSLLPLKFYEPTEEIQNNCGIIKYICKEQVSNVNDWIQC